ncbi:Structural maintenance of chromosomes protein 4 [Tritrichomonas foetus]|uniref:Structural maintenance of chromosomes protein 4 n=1 Tax=Tritrichomonas foetus TaxID=1144522 RepID=A0A1J4J0D8_9EUKA|nr:Structural maintenance of chromosomes protein 4 [Tritrichomonas foetus]|eukprot:OHS92882.1 Structural maintenance of chromosomes protein 4 [Tritrichomonas foetus]
MKPMATNQNQTGLLEYIEDIIGSNKFIPDIQNVEKELVEANEKREQIAERVSISKRDRDALVGARDEAQKYLDLEAKMKQVDAKRLINTQAELEKSLEKAKAAEEEFSEELNKKKEERDKQEEQVKELENSIKSKEKELEKLKPALDKAQKILNALKNDSTKLKTEKKGAERIIEDCKQTNTTATKEIEASKLVIIEKGKAKEEIQKEVDSANQKLEVAKADLEEKTNEVKVEIEKLQEKLQEAKEKFAKGNADFLELETVMTQSQDEIDAINRKFADSQKARAEKEQALETSQRAVDELNHLIPEKTERLETLRNRHEELKHIIDDKGKNLETSIQRARDVGQRVNEMRREYEKGQSKDKVYNFIMNYKPENGDINVYGRLRDLGSIDPKYDVPISTAAGQKLNSFVVQNVNEARACVEALRKNHVGTGTFIALDQLKCDKQTLNRVMDKNNIPKDTDLILNKIKIQKRGNIDFLPAFYHVFRDTLIAPNIEVAKRVGYGKERRRVVTMDGTIVDRSGVMSGGGNTKSRGGMATVDVNELKKGQAELSSLDDNIKLLRQEIDQYRREFASINVNAIELDLRKMNMDLQQHQQQITYINDQLSRMTDVVQSEEDIQKINELNSYIDEHKEELETRRNEVNELKNDSLKIEKEISEIVNIRTKAQKDKIAQIEKQLETFRKSMAKNDSTIKAAERKIDRFEKTLKENADTEKKTLADLEKLDKNIEKNKEKKSESKEEVKTLSDNVSELETATKSDQESVREIKSSFNSLKLKVEQMKTDLNKKINETKSINKELKNISARIENLGIATNDLGELEEKTMEELELQRVAIEHQLSELDPDLTAIQEYEEREKVHQQHLDEFNEADRNRNDIMNHCNELKQQRLHMFMDGFGKIAQKLKETYQVLTLGGDAELEFADRFDPFSQGINFSVRPPGKSWKHISNLSGGEQTLSSLSLVFSLHQFKPTPFYIMDEIDAALDFRNVSIIANYLKERTTNAQFIVVSLRNHMFELADRLIGVFKVADCASAIIIENKIPVTNENEAPAENENTTPP